MQINPTALRSIREKDGYTQADFARTIGISPAHLAHVEAGDRGCAEPVIKRMAETLKVPISAITTGQSAPKPGRKPKSPASA